MLELLDLSRRFGDIVALDGVTFSVPDGEIVGFVGPNGAGKTTTMRIALGVLEPDAGDVRWNGFAIDAEARRRFGYMPEERGLYPKMKVLEQLVYLARLHGLTRPDASRRAAETIEVLGVAERANDRVENLSLGNQQRVQLAAALVHRPDVLILDEPFSGLDPVGVDALTGVLRGEAEGRGVPVVFSSHQLELVERLCDRVVLIDHGRIVAAGTIEELRSSRERRRLRVQVAGAPDEWYDAIPGVRLVEDTPNDGVVLDIDDDVDEQRVLDLARGGGRRHALQPGARVAGRAVPGSGADVSLPGGGVGSDARETDRGTWWLVAQRDFWYRLRDKGFVISSGITLAVLTGLIVISAYGGSGTPTFDLGLLGQGSGRLGPLVVQAGDAQGTVIRTRPVADRDAADAALADGSLGAVLVDGKSLLAEREVPTELQSAVQTAVVADGIRTTLEANDVPADEIAHILNPAPVPVETLEPQDPNRETNSTVAFIAVVILYGQLFGYGVWVATGVIEEKASRVVEILLSTIRARQLLAGKILGIGTLGLLQLIVIATYSIVLASMTGALDFPAHALGTAALAIGWFMLGFAFYASLFAVAGSLVSRMEELQNVIVPLNLVILVSFFLAIGATSDPTSTLSRIVSIVPFSSALAMPVRISLGAATPFEVVAALVASIGSTALLIPLAGRVYSGAVLRTGARVKLRDAWRSASN